MYSNVNRLIMYKHAWIMLVYFTVNNYEIFLNSLEDYPVSSMRQYTEKLDCGGLDKNLAVV